MSLGLKQFRQEGCLSYFWFDTESRELAVIDPRLELMEDYREYIAQNALKPAIALDTHTHADHFSATHVLAAEYRCEIGMSARTRSERPRRKLAAGDRIAVGRFSLQALETPGHTPDSVCYAGEGVVFTGDTLFIGSTGRTDFEGADPGQQWDSLHRLLEALPGPTLVLPAHDYSDLICSTLETERRKNPHLLVASRDEFVRMKRSESVSNPSEEIRKRVAYNLARSPAGEAPAAGAATACGVQRADDRPMAAINVEKYAHKLEEGGEGIFFVDVREREEFREGHMPGTRNIPLSEIGLRLGELSRGKRVYVSCLGGFRSSMAARTLSYLGLGDVVDVSGGFKAWTHAGLPVER